MNSLRRILPIGIQSFSKIRTADFYYVDKTQLALALAREAGYFFLSRPRRFGKSLFLDTLKELFEGNEALFHGLHIHDKWDWTTRFPVIWISFGGGVINTKKALDEKIRELLADNQRRLGIQCTHNSISGQFFQLIALAHEKFGQRAVVLIDEYDKPILDNIANSKSALAMREGLKNLYTAIKDADAHIRFALLTGVSKFSKVSLFSGLNNLNDITLNPDYSAICGYTDADVDAVFAQELPGLDRDKMRRWYNGYNWLGEAVYNPFDLLRLFHLRKFGCFWFESATPSFLVKLLTERQTWLPTLGQMEVDSDLLSAFDVDDISSAALMFQSGYLTIDREELLDDDYFYLLRFPNHEVYKSLYGSLLRTWTANPEKTVQNRKALPRLLATRDFAGLKALFQSFYSSIPHHWYTNNPIAQYEGYYASVFYAYFAAAGLDARAEDAGNFGRIDMTVKMAGQIYIFEFKVLELGGEGAALRQIKDRGYADKYRAEGLPIYLLGVEFSRKTRNVERFDTELA